MTNTIFPWHESAWRELQKFGQRLPHAILFHGTEGTGKTAFVEQFAQSLLCEKPLTEQRACGVCDACGWFAQYSHPDFRRVRPEALDDDGEAESDGVETPDDTKKSAKSTKAPSKEIKIDQIRGLADFMNVSTHRQGKRVVILYPAEALNTAASNALLKMLEEPPPDTVFLLVSNSLDRLLPTILSRCRKFALSMPDGAQALAWLSTQGIASPESWLAEQGGAPLAALEQAQAGNRDGLDALLTYLSAPSVEGALKTAEQCAKTPVVHLVGWSQRWLYDLFSYKLSGRIRYYPRYQSAFAKLAKQVEVGSLMQVAKAFDERRAIANHPLSAKLFIEDMLLSYSAMY
ncbi:MAG: DNA polymerase III subunit delta' [Pseudomonadota bacterium]